MGELGPARTKKVRRGKEKTYWSHFHGGGENNQVPWRRERLLENEYMYEQLAKAEG